MVRPTSKPVRVKDIAFKQIAAITLEEIETSVKIKTVVNASFLWKS